METKITKEVTKLIAGNYLSQAHVAKAKGVEVPDYVLEALTKWVIDLGESALKDSPGFKDNVSVTDFAKMDMVNVNRDTN